MSAPPQADPKGTVGFSSAVVLLAILAVLFAQSRSPGQQTDGATPVASASSSGSDSFAPSSVTDESLDDAEVFDPDVVDGLPPTTATTAPGPDGRWVAALFAADESHEVNAGQEQARLEGELGVGLDVLFSGDYTSLNCCYFVVHYDGGFRTGEEALEWCASVGRTTKELCHGRFVSTEPGLDPGSRALIAEP
jgi:hypothetical protein